jgi:hypothetical protein
MLKFIAGMQVNGCRWQVNERGDAYPNALKLTPGQQAEMQLAEIEAAKLGSVAASAVKKLAGGVIEADIERLCASGGFTTSQRLF